MKIAILGYGKMGREIEEIAASRKHELILKANIHTQTTAIAEGLKNADVAIEFSTPGSVLGNIYSCFKAGVPVIVGTTGWYENFEEVKKKCQEEKQALFHATNFSVGMNVFFKVNEYLARLMKNYPEYDVKMEETHHVHKLDSPSGTSITLANQVISHIGRKTKWKEGKASTSDELEIHSKRKGEIPGTHTICYTSSVDDIEISHIAHNRKGFATGAVLAAEWIVGKKGIFTMNDLLNIS